MIFLAILKNMLHLHAATGRSQARPRILDIPSEINDETFYPFLHPRDVWSLSVVCMGLRVVVATSDNYWSKVRNKVLSKRTASSVPFYDWSLKEGAQSRVAQSWATLKLVLSSSQISSLLPPVSLDRVLAVEKKCCLEFPLEVIISLVEHHSGQAIDRIQGTQLTGEHFMVPLEQLAVVLQTQLDRGLKQTYLPMFVDSSFQKCICVDCSTKEGRVIGWSPLYEAQWGDTWSSFLLPR